MEIWGYDGYDGVYPMVRLVTFREFSTPFPHMFPYFPIVSHENQKLFYMSQYCPIVSLHFPIKSMAFSPGVWVEFGHPEVTGAFLLRLKVARDFEALQRPLLPVLSPPLRGSFASQGVADGKGKVRWSGDLEKHLKLV
jgi:hypothetical protein